MTYESDEWSEERDPATELKKLADLHAAICKAREIELQAVGDKTQTLTDELDNIRAAIYPDCTSDNVMALTGVGSLTEAVIGVATVLNNNMVALTGVDSLTEAVIGVTTALNKICDQLEINAHYIQSELVEIKDAINGHE